MFEAGERSDDERNRWRYEGDQRGKKRKKRRRRRKKKGRREGEGREERTKAVAAVAAAVTSRLVFLITPDPGRVEEEEKLLSDVSIMTRLCTEVCIYRPRKTLTACGARGRRVGGGGEERKGEEKQHIFVYASGLFPPREQGGNRKAR